MATEQTTTPASKTEEPRVGGFTQGLPTPPAAVGSTQTLSTSTGCCGEPAAATTSGCCGEVVGQSSTTGGGCCN